MIPKNKINLDEITEEDYRNVNEDVSGLRRVVYTGLGIVAATILLNKCADKMHKNTVYERIDAQQEQVDQQRQRVNQQNQRLETMRDNSFYIENPCYNQQTDNIIDVTPCYNQKTE